MTYLYIFLTIVLGILVTWGLGLSVPLALEAIVRRPFRRIWAAVLAGLLFALNIVVFTLLGSQSRTHAALVLVAIATYYILRRGIGPLALIAILRDTLYGLLRPSSLAVFFWLKYLRKRRIILLSIAAVAVSVCLLIVVASLFTGFIDAYERTGIEILGDVVLSAPYAETFEKYPQFIEQLEQTSIVEAATATLSCDGLLHLGKGDVRPVSVWGIDPQSRARVMTFRSTLVLEKNTQAELSWNVPGGSSEEGGYVGIALMADPNARTDEYDTQAILKEAIGKRVSLITASIPENADSQKLPEQKVIPFTITDLVFTGFYEVDSGFVFIPIRRLQEALYPNSDVPRAKRIHVKLKPGVVPELAVAEIRRLWNTFATEQLGWSSYLASTTSVETAQQVQQLYVEEIRKQMGVLLLIFGLVSFSVVVLVFCIFYMMVRLKQGDVAILKSCGTSSVSVAWLFLGFGITVGIAGACVGAALGYVITKNINVIENWIRIVFGLKLWSSSVYMFTRIPNEVDWAAALPIVALAIMAAALGALVPALVAARTRPVEVLRYE
jgi:lipoprotein-releasing system permease protein